MQATRLQRAIKTHQPLSVLKELKLNIDNHGIEALEIAASQGDLHVVAWLLNEGVPVRSIDEKLAEQQPLIAKFLTACHAYSHTVDSVVAEAICFRALHQEEKGLADCVIPNLARPQDFIALALERKNTETAQKLINRARERKQELKYTDFSNFTPGFWAAVHDLNLLNDVHIDAENWLLTLEQLYAEKKPTLLDKTHDAAPKLVQNDFYEKKPILDEKISVPFKTAAAANNDALKKLNLTLENYYDLFIEAYAKKNYVAIKTILDCCDMKALLKLFLMNKQEQMSLFLLIAGNFHLYDLAISFRDDANLPKFIEQFRQPLEQYKTFSAWEAEKKAAHLNHQIQHLSGFTTALDEKIKSTRCYEERFDCNTRWKKLWLIITFLALGTGISFLMQPGAWERGDNGEQGNGLDIAGLLLTIFSGLSTVTILSVLGLDSSCRGSPPQTWGRLIKVGNEARFYELPINRYSDEIQQAANAIFAEFAEVKTNPFANRTLDSKVSDVLPDIKQLLEEKQTALKQLQIIPETKVEIKLEVKKEEPMPEEQEEEKDELAGLFKPSSQSHGLFSQTDSTPLLPNAKHESKRAFS